MVKFFVCVFVCLVATLESTDSTINIYTCDSGDDVVGSVVAFSVARKNDFITKTKSRIAMDVELFNEGAHFSGVTNQFTAPITGLYSFYYGASSDYNKVLHIYLYAGNPEKPVAVAYDHTKGHGHAGGRVLLKLKKGDTASMWSHGDNSGKYGLDGYAPPAIHFNGYLIRKLE